MDVPCFRQLACFLLLCGGPLCLAQAVTIQVINGDNGRPLQKQIVSVTILYGKGESAPAKYDATLDIETDVNGAAQFRLPEPAPAQFAAQVRMDWARWHCGCGVLAVTQVVIQKGIVESAADRKKSAVPMNPVPGQILFVARPLSLFERLLSPLLKG
jgi:hypothetical protein